MKWKFTGLKAVLVIIPGIALIVGAAFLAVWLFTEAWNGFSVPVLDCKPVTMMQSVWAITLFAIVGRLLK